MPRRKTAKLLLSVAEVADQLGISDQSVYNLIHSGELPSIRVCPRKGYRVRAASVESFLTHRRVRPTRLELPEPRYLNPDAMRAWADELEPLASGKPRRAHPRRKPCLRRMA